MVGVEVKIYPEFVILEYNFEFGYSGQLFGLGFWKNFLK